MRTGVADRIQSLDILRGLALLGMFFVHFHVNSTEPGGFDDVIRSLIWRLVETKSHGAFAVLFGAGFAIQLRRSEERGQPFVRHYLRRLAVLALFGFAAHACFGFNVLLGYALWGVPLLVLRTWPTRALIIVALLSASSVMVYQVARDRYLQWSVGPTLARAVAENERAEAAKVNSALHVAESGDSYRALLIARLRHMAWFYTQPFFFLPGATLALFIVGYLFVRHRVFEDVRAHTRLLVVLALFAVVSWLADNWLLDLWGMASFGLLRDQWLTFAYISGVLLLLSRRPQLIVRLHLVANAGRMALTNYMIQIAMLDFLFSGYALGVGRVRPVVGLAAAVGCFAAEVAISTAWLQRFRLGPAEWLWRSLTYGRAEPLRRVTLPAAWPPVSV